MSNKIPLEDELGEQPPIFSSWNTWYVIVLVAQALLILFFWAFSRLFS